MPDGDIIDSRFENARENLMVALDTLRRGTLSDIEADAVASAIEDELCPPGKFPTRALTYPVTSFWIGVLTGFLVAVAVVWWALWFLGKN